MYDSVRRRHGGGHCQYVGMGVQLGDEELESVRRQLGVVVEQEQ